ncbi:MAG: HlyD family efflux transporter periplasmic adaptor subunit [Streptococcus peroris]|uniref:HlyD family efflux transporter periplasmic adaptor subunit n=1 Tax=Streptococcus peroris TaxID=68891 RepID=UPI002906752C|nr:HlyD family efflux transporter periplasmic adaptor subunit [Streptococcus peroris]MDU7074976.1 HlyD family efflux transporter periplasmic adaptor subunit [Streptococcus peroris]
MHKEFLESAEFYNRRYHNFSSRVILPMSFLIVFLFGFSVFVEKEISLSSKATVEPSRIISNIQSASNQRMAVNHMEENKRVQRGELLVQYQKIGDENQPAVYNSQFEMPQDYKSKASGLKNGEVQQKISITSQKPQKQEILEGKLGKNSQSRFLEEGVIRAEEDGILHLNPEIGQYSVVAEGTPLAKLYPPLDREGKTKLTAYISSKDITGIRMGDPVRFTTSNDNNNQVLLVSKITGIDTIATRTDQGNFFKIEAETSVTEEEAQNLRYGLEGRLRIMIGKKSYFRYYLDKFLNRD